MKEEGYSVALLHSELQGFERDQVFFFFPDFLKKKKFEYFFILGHGRF